jgi:hypothetical protein
MQSRLETLRNQEAGLIALLKEVQRSKDKGDDSLLDYNIKKQNYYYAKLNACRDEMQKLEGVKDAHSV